MTYKVQYQDVPFNYTDPAVLVVDAESKEDAFAVSYDALTRRGKAVLVSMIDLRDRLSLDPNQVFTKLLGKSNSETSFIGGRTHIREISEYKVQSQGRVVQG